MLYRVGYSGIQMVPTTTLVPEVREHHFADNVFKCIFLLRKILHFYINFNHVSGLILGSN